MTEPPADDPQRHRRFRTRGVSVATRLAAAVLLVSLVSLAVATLVGLSSGSGLGRDIYQTRLTTLRAAGASDVAGVLQSTRSATEALALSPATADVIDAFGRAFSALPENGDFDPTAASSELTTAYEDVVLSKLGPSGVPPAIGDIATVDPGALYLQTEYSIETVDAETGEVVIGEPSDGQSVEVRVVTDPGRLGDAGDGSEWSAVHREYHPAYRRMRDDLGVLDLYFVEPDDSRIVYSVNKGADLGTSLVTGPFGGSVLANTVARVVDDPGAGTAVSDLSLYDATPGAVVGVMASPVMDGEDLAGVVAVVYDGDQFTDLLTSAALANDLLDDDIDEARIEVDAYLIGADGTTRSNPLSYVADPTAFLDLSEASGLLSESKRAEIEANRTTVLVQPAPGATVTAAETGDDDVAERPSMTGDAVYTTVGPVPFDGVQWYVASEAGLATAETALDDFGNILIVGASLFVIVIAFVAVGWATRLLSPVRTISERLGAIDVDHGPLTIPERSPVEMHHLVSSFDSMAATLDHQKVALALAREERLGLLRRLLPTAVAERLAKGDVESLERVPQASAVVLVVRGLGQLVRAGNFRTNRDLVDRLHSELDELAEHHGLDRIKVVGDAYFAACGHDRPFIDHAPRVVTFAADSLAAVRAIGVAAVGRSRRRDRGRHRRGVGGDDRRFTTRVRRVGRHRQHRPPARPERPRRYHLVSDTTHAMLPEDIECDDTDGMPAAWRCPTSRSPGRSRVSTSSFLWAIVVIVVVPLTVLAVSEFDERLRQRDSPLRGAIGIVRTWALPFFATWVVLRPVLGRDVDSLGVQLVTTALIVALGAAVLRVLRVLVDGLAGRPRRDGRGPIPQLLLALPRIVRAAHVAWVLLSDVWSVNLSSLLTALGVTSLVVSFALQDTLSGLASGFLLLSDQPFQPGDWIISGDDRGYRDRSQLAHDTDPHAQRRHRDRAEQPAGEGEHRQLHRTRTGPPDRRATAGGLLEPADARQGDAARCRTRDRRGAVRSPAERQGRVDRRPADGLRGRSLGGRLCDRAACTERLRIAGLVPVAPARRPVAQPGTGPVPPRRRGDGRGSQAHPGVDQVRPPAFAAALPARRRRHRPARSRPPSSPATQPVS